MEGMVSWEGGGKDGGQVGGDILGGMALGGGGERSSSRRFHSSCINLALHRCPPILLDAIQ